EDMHLPGQPDAPLPSGNLPGDQRSPVDNGRLFGVDSYEAILYGLDFLRAECTQWFGATRPPSRAARTVAQRVAAAPAKLPPHDAWLREAVGMPRYTAARRA
ncbi:MAG TPA: hypothetical protein VFE85_07265, partial [Woeseiaceae bacterium]|nr:hypothetical protein [Woeseiaceae bacterium]